MTLIQRYLLTTFGRLTMLALSAFSGIYLLVDFFEKVDDFLEHQAAPAFYLSYFLCKIPLIISQVLPLSVLLGTFLTLGSLSKSHELTAMRAGGIGLARVVLPLCVATLLLCVSHFGINEYLLPSSLQKANHILRVEVKGKSESLGKRQNLWFRDASTINHIRLALPEAGRLHGITLYQINAANQLTVRFDADKAFFENNAWVANQAVIREFNPSTGQLLDEKRFNRISIPLNKTPHDFAVTNGKSDELNFRLLKELSDRLRREGLDATRYLVDMHSRLAAPLASLVMFLLAIPFALQKSRNINLALGISISVLIGVSFFVVQSTLMALGYSAILPPGIAAWSANLIFLLLGLFLILSTRD
ncbi:MAG: LPS export ABC transporter permease LptG [Desulfuromonadaceae bacterium]|nr:LPS export ABC transporter permease LptG [Desulfuromonadaceae bacterium]